MGGACRVPNTVASQVSVHRSLGMPSHARAQPRLAASQLDRSGDHASSTTREAPPEGSKASPGRKARDAALHLAVERRPEAAERSEGAAEDAVLQARDARAAFLQVRHPPIWFGSTAA